MSSRGVIIYFSFLQPVYLASKVLIIVIIIIIVVVVLPISLVVLQNQTSRIPPSTALRHSLHHMKPHPLHNRRPTAPAALVS